MISLQLCEIYDLRTDPLEKHNLAGHLPERRVAHELTLLASRFEALRRNFNTMPNAFHDPDPYGARLSRAAFSPVDSACAARKEVRSNDPQSL